MISDGAGGLWLGLGLENKMGRLRDGKYTSVEPSAGLPETDPRSFFLDSRGWLWIGLRYKGVSMTREPGAENPSFINFSHEQNQISSNAVRSIAEDDTGKIYFATDRGLDRFDPNTNQWTHFTTKNGLAGSTISFVLKDRRGFIWAATDGGLSRLDPRKERIAQNSPPPIYLTRVQIAGENLNLPETGTNVIAPRELSSSSTNLALEFVAPNFQNQDDWLYQYQLTGVDADWSKPTKGAPSLLPGCHLRVIRLSECG